MLLMNSSISRSSLVSHKRQGRSVFHFRINPVNFLVFFHLTALFAWILISAPARSALAFPQFAVSLIAIIIVAVRVVSSCSVQVGIAADDALGSSVWLSIRFWIRVRWSAGLAAAFRAIAFTGFSMSDNFVVSSTDAAFRCLHFRNIEEGVCSHCQNCSDGKDDDDGELGKFLLFYLLFWGKDLNIHLLHLRGMHLHWFNFNCQLFSEHE